MNRHLTRWWWVRHGPTHQRCFTGWRDVPADLSDHDHIARLDTHLPRDALLVSSDLLRAVATADVLAEGRTRLPHAAAIREFDFGDWDGCAFDEVLHSQPEAARAFWKHPGEAAPPGGESWNEAASRVTGFVDGLTRTHPGRDIVAVAHLGVILTQLRRAGELTAAEAITQHIAPLSVTRIDGDGVEWQLRQVNHEV
ncbi:histidine phosphatase family protein [Acidimangrovimonas pyrenivorans]|uniref:Histidine phosphatase family protein n=1 Tax=Acidimangrovimonas pyrenivorans TaxID=2030798 RepID=A0ABV7ALJ8_9RHOB